MITISRLAWQDQNAVLRVLILKVQQQQTCVFLERSQLFDTVIIFALPDKRIFRIDHKSNPNGG